ncbi:tripartite tricarboxylate transporter TctB family protein [Arthrobacter sp. NicSoilC12]|uniref:tripartite tricarboxylate transporter TctB family protein n=1 Tax=Arthrobacter sp. NicSoilC12 TaxID=2831001 RepID=UPI001CC660E9|nr:tripartite tricarboxylate transporter TctB family protein [Arthrobacter sp. NicSoilC12]GIU57442.1 hypothetical protein NicSoilC12_31910 [Arthrobacter sp. NicSoilC12]
MSSSPAVPAGGGSRPAAPSGGDAPEATADEILEDLTPEQLAAQWEDEKPPAAGALANAASSLVVLGVGTGALALSVAMGLGTPAAPEPGLWPFMISCVMVVLGLFQLTLGRHNRDAEKFTPHVLRTPDWAHHPRRHGRADAGHRF